MNSNFGKQNQTSFLQKIEENSKEIEEEIEKIYEEEYNENFEYILLKKDSDFMKLIRENVKITLVDKYKSECLENELLLKILKEKEKNLYSNNYLIDKEKINESLLKINKEENNQKFSFLKHCKYQSNNPIHYCNESNNFMTIINSEKKIDLIICLNCLKSYKSSFIKLYCDFCQINYYTKIITNENNSNDNFLQPATWEKYHCHLIINQQMICINCKKGNLFLDIKSNKLICKKCDFRSDPYNIIWTCIKCGQDFNSYAKIYNPYIYKSLSLCIKKGIIEKKLAVPKKFPCGHFNKNLFHKKDCDGSIFFTYYNGRKMVLCSKCKSIIKYEKFIFICPQCNLRFRDEINEEDFLIEKENEMKKKEEEKKYVEEYYKKIFEKNIDFSNKSLEISTNPNSNTNYSDNLINKDSFEQINNNKSKTLKSVSPNKSKENIIQFEYKSVSEKKNNLNNELNNELNNDDNNNNFSISKNLQFEFEKEKIINLNIKEEKEKNENENENNKIIKKNNLPFFEIKDYEIITQISESLKSKVFCVRKIDDNKFFTMKKKYIRSKEDLENYLNLYELQYNYSDDIYITKVFGVNYNEEEISILTECGINSWASEITTYKKMKKFYSEEDLINIIYQISLALENLQKKNLAHFCINPFNITVFKNNIYKITDFEHVTCLNSKNIIQNDNKFISPDLNYLFHSKKLNGGINLIKNDVYSLGLCCLFTMIKNNNIDILIRDFINIDKFCKNEEIIQKYINNVMKAKKDNNFYSKKFIQLICNMMKNNEEERYDFNNIIDYICKEYEFECE